MTSSSLPSQAPATPNSTLLRVGDIAKATGKTVRAIHLYEELGLLRPVTRSSGGFRLYDQSAVDRVRWIDSLHGLGFSLQEMREVLQNWWSAEQGASAMTSLRDLFGRKLEETRDLIRRHQQLERELEEGLRYLATCENCAAPGPVHECVLRPGPRCEVAAPAGGRHQDEPRERAQVIAPRVRPGRGHFHFIERRGPSGPARTVTTKGARGT